MLITSLPLCHYRETLQAQSNYPAPTQLAAAALGPPALTTALPTVFHSNWGISTGVPVVIRISRANQVQCLSLTMSDLQGLQGSSLSCLPLWPLPSLTTASLLKPDSRLETHYSHRSMHGPLPEVTPSQLGNLRGKCGEMIAIYMYAYDRGLPRRRSCHLCLTNSSSPRKHSSP